MHTIATVTMNPCIDKTMYVTGFTHGGINRATQTRQDAAGKGINVSVALKHLGVDSLCLGVNFHENGTLLTHYLDAMGIAHDFVYADGAIRTNIKILEQDTQIMTEVNMRGAPVPESAVASIIAKAVQPEIDILILSGSLPPGVDADFYGQVIAQTGAGTAVILDADGDRLKAGLSGSRKPFLIKPNLYELESAFGVTLPDCEAIMGFCQDTIIKAYGVTVVCVSMGKDGALLVTAEGAWHSPGLALDVRGVQGAGDSLVAGITLAMTQHLPYETWLRYAAAAAAGSVVREGTLMCTRENFDAMMTRVSVQPYARRV